MLIFAGVRRVPNSLRWEVSVQQRSVGDPGLLILNPLIERRYRAGDLQKLETEAINGVRSFSGCGEFDDECLSKIVAAIRHAIYDAEDAAREPND